MTKPLHLLLASASPRRRQIITELKLPFSVDVAPTDEDLIQEQYYGPIDGLGQWTASHKALATLAMPETAQKIVVAADTTVLFEDRVLNKPRDPEHAREMLLVLRGRWHRVVTGVAVGTMRDGKLELHAASCTTPVLMRAYSEKEVAAYVATGDPLDKAGSYGIQHPEFQPTERIDGCYLNVVGLPLCVLVDLLARFDVYPARVALQGSSLRFEGDTACPWSERCIR